MNPNYEHLKETCEASELIFDGKVLHVYVDQINLPNGAHGFREYIKHIGAVAVLPLTDASEVICVRQYRYAVGDVLTEIPAGKLDFADEDRRVAAERELREETGARCEKLTHLGTYLGSPAILNERIELYLAEGLTFGETDFDEDEFIEIVKIPLSTLVDEALAGGLPDGKTQLAVLKVAEILRRRNEEMNFRRINQ
ncbi:MAG: NUDIX hydrolase [Clostridia bacterium]|nr:NUDIX hydrolase [Clostridia bacterium]